MNKIGKYLLGVFGTFAIIETAGLIVFTSLIACCDRIFSLGVKESIIFFSGYSNLFDDGFDITFFPTIVYAFLLYTTHIYISKKENYIKTSNILNMIFIIIFFIVCWMLAGDYTKDRFSIIFMFIIFLASLVAGFLGNYFVYFYNRIQDKINGEV